MNESMPMHRASSRSWRSTSAARGATAASVMLVWAAAAMAMVPAASLAGANELAGAEVPEAAETCGTTGLPPCPLQSFMRTNVAVPLARGDMAALAEALNRVASLQPPGFDSWAALARKGIDAAGKGDRGAVRSACDGCHQTWRAEYRKRYRDRPL